MYRQISASVRLLLILVASSSALPGKALVHAAADSAAVDRAFDGFFAAADPTAASKLIKDVAATSVTFDEAYSRLKKGRSYSRDVAHGQRRLTRHTSDGLEHEYIIVIPENYDPSHAYQVRFQLHGGIARPNPVGREQVDRIVGNRDQIYVHPSGWVRAMWWQANQVENIDGILDSLKRVYNVDENRVYLTGISDGGTGAYFFAFRDTTPWAAFLPLNGHMMVLANPNTEADGDIHPGNAVNKPFFIVNGGRDPLYPTRSVEPYINHLRSLGTEIVYRPQPTAGHNTDWWPTEKDHFEDFAREHPRSPLPDRISWETERTDRYNRAHWLTIDELGAVPGETHLADSAIVELGAGAARFSEEAFPQTSPSGRVDLVRSGNTITASTRGVRAFTVLVSPDHFDFSAPIKVVANRHVVFDAKVEKSVPALLKWAAKDNDRTMLFGAEIKIRVK